MTSRTSGLPIEKWPRQDSNAWGRAFKRGDIFKGEGLAANWSEGSRKSILTSYRRWLEHLDRFDPQALTEQPGPRITPSRVQGYVRQLRKEVSVCTQRNHVSHLCTAMGVLAPDRDREWLLAIRRRLTQLTRPKPKRDRLVPSERLVELGLSLIERAGWATALTPLYKAVLVRDGLLISLLATRPIRRNNLVNLQIGRHLLQRKDGGFDLLIPAAETKNRRHIEFRVPDFLTPNVHAYLSEYRPTFLNAQSHNWLWASAMGGQLCAEAVNDAVARHTRNAFGFSISPHMFRSCVATTIAELDPAATPRATLLLGHHCPETAERFYNRAGAIEVGRTHQQRLLAIRKGSRA